MDTGDKILQAIFDHAALGIAQISLDGSLLRLNNRYCQMLGYSQSELLTMKIWDVTHPADSDEVSIARRQLLEGAISSHSMEKRYIRKDGTAFWGRLNRSLVRDDDGFPQYFIAVIEDITEKRQAEQALRDSEQRLRLAVSTGVGVWEYDLRSRIPALSPQYNRAAGRAPLTSQEWLNLVHPDDRERVMALVRESINGLSDWNAEFRLLYPDGSIRWMLSKGTVLLDDDGWPARMAGVSIDITERQRNEEALRRSEQRLELAQQVAGIGTWDWDVGANETHCSSGYGRLYGLPPGDLAPPPERWINLIYPEDRDRIREGLDRALTHTHRFREEFRVVWPDGTIHWIYGEGQVLRNTEGNPIRMIGVNVDIDDRKRADAALRESEARFRNLADTAPVMIWVVGPDKRATFFNKCCIDFTGRALEEKLGDGWVAGLHPEDRDQFLTEFSSSIDARRQFRAVFRLRRADGEYRWVLCTGVPRSAPDDTFSGYTGSCLDITELKRTEEEALARHKLESVGVLAGGIAHDFNNLLGSILMEAEIAAAELAAGLSPDEEITKISTIAMRGAEIVRQLMIYSGEDQAGAVEPVDLSRLTAEMLELMGVSISKHAVLKSNLDKNLPAVWGNAPQIRQVLMNLVINASEAIGEKEGVIQVTTSRVSGGEASGLNNAANAPADGYVRLTVSDSGCGLTEEARAKIFDPFFTTKFAGRGLGLAVVQGIVRAHGGAIEVVSAPGLGATFQVLLPCTPERALGSENAVVSSEADRSLARAGTSGTVLVVEDEKDLLPAISKALQKRGFSVMEAKDGSVAKDLIRTCGADIDVILLDVTLPGTSSREVLEEAQRLRPSLKVVLTSAYDRKTVNASFPGLQITQFIRKPFKLDDLVGTLTALMAGSRTEPSLREVNFDRAG